jgi:hypothetical protein
MGQLVVLYGSLAEGLRVKGPYRNWGETIRAKKAIHDDHGCCVIEGVILTKADASLGGEFVLVLGSVSEGLAVYGTYATAVLAADASSPFRPDPINPNTPDGQRQACILRLQPA